MDRFFKGFIAGSIGGAIMSIWDFISFYVLNFSKHRYSDWSSILLLENVPATFIESVYALLMHLIWAGFLGILFAFLIIAIGKKGLLLKGVIIGFITGFSIYCISNLFETIHLFDTPIESVISNHIGSAIWGVTTAYFLLLLDKKYGD